MHDHPQGPETEIPQTDYSSRSQFAVATSPAGVIRGAAASACTACDDVGQIPQDEEAEREQRAADAIDFKARLELQLRERMAASDGRQVKRRLSFIAHWLYYAVRHGTTKHAAWACAAKGVTW